MPTYSYKCPVCSRGRDIIKKLSDIDRPEPCPNCSFSMTRQLAAPAVRGDYEPYSCPITGKIISGRKAHEENLARHGCRVLEPGEREAQIRRASASEQALDSAIESTAEEFVSSLSGDEANALGTALESGATAEVIRGS